MKTPLLLAALLLLIPTLLGCKSSREREQQQQFRAAFAAGQRSAQMQFQQSPQQQSGITLIGEVRKNHLLWRPELTVSQAVFEAEYVGMVQPRSIFVVREGRRYQIDVNSLLNGQDDPEVLPGDIISIQR